MIISLRELSVTCENALRVLGLDASAAAAGARLLVVAELEWARGLDALDSMIREDRHLAVEPLAFSREGEATVVEARGNSALVVLPLALDLLAATLADTASCVLEIRNVRDPGLGLSIAEVARRRWLSVAVSHSSNGDVGTVLLHGAPGARSKAGSIWALERGYGWLTCDGRASTRELEAVRLGVAVEMGRWQRLEEFARGVLVDASPRSRLDAGPFSRSHSPKPA